jgi:hypothetical protein
MTGKSATEPMVTLPRELGTKKLDRPGRKFRAFMVLDRGAEQKSVTV